MSEELITIIRGARAWIAYNPQESTICVPVSNFVKILDAAEKQRKWVILFKGVNEWEEFTGTEQEAHAHAICDDRHLNFSCTGYTLLPS